MKVRVTGFKWVTVTMKGLTHTAIKAAEICFTVYICDVFEARNVTFCRSLGYCTSPVSPVGMLRTITMQGLALKSIIAAEKITLK